MAESRASVIETVRVEQLACIQCQQVMDVAHLSSFSEIKCPACGTSQTVPAKFGAFLLLNRLGFGGMGVVFHAVDRELGRHVAIKVMKRELGENPEFVKSFRHEAQAAAALNHRNVAQIYSFGQVAGQHYIVMELVDGGRLEDLMARGPLDETRTMAIHLDVAEGLNAASEIGLIHGDIKPANILFGANGEAKVLDFGLASFIGQQHLQGGQVWGTPYYIAPEKARGKKVDFRSDIYSLGATIFHVLAGRVPFEAPTPMDVVMLRLKRPAPSLQNFRADLHPETVAMVARMMEADPAMRYPSYPALIVDLRAAMEASRLLFRKPGSKSTLAGLALPAPPRSKQPPFLRRPEVKIMLACALAAGLAVTAWWRFTNQRQAKAAAAAAAEQAALQAELERGRDAQGRVQTIAQTIKNSAAPLQTLGQEIARLAILVPATEPAMIELRQAAAQLRLILEDLGGDRALAAAAYELMEAAASSPEARPQAAALESLAAGLAELNAALDEVKASAAASLARAGEVQKLAQDALDSERRAAADAAAAAAAAKVAAAQAKRLKEEEDRRLALAQAQEAERQRPAITQRELDRLDEERAAIAPFIQRRQFEEAAKALARLQPELTMAESKAYCGAMIEACQRMERMRAFIVKAAHAAPYPKGWITEAAPRDILDANLELGVTIGVGSAGKLLMAWEKVSVWQMLKMTQYYAQAPGAPAGEGAQALLGAALFCYESGGFQLAENAAQAACQKDPSLKEAAERLMPGFWLGP